MAHRIAASASFATTPDAVFRQITDLEHLPLWNRAITDVVEVPPSLEPRSVWKVTLHAMGRTWISRSEVRSFNPSENQIGYRSQSDDGNPSYADWDWRIIPSVLGAEVPSPYASFPSPSGAVY